MIEAEPAPDEARRITALHALNVLDTPAEERFDRITRAAARLLDVPIALISLVDTDREWFKSCVGLDLPEIARDASFCAYAIRQDEILIIKDTRFVPRFANNPLVTSEPHVRFYAGCPLSTPDGSKLGALCIMDRSPRQMSAGDLQAIRDLAAWAEHELNAGNRSRLTDIVYESKVRLRAIVDNMAEGIITFNERGSIVSLNPAAERMFGYASPEVSGQSIKRLIPETFRSESTGHLTSRLLEGDTAIIGTHGEVTGRRKDGTTFPIDMSVNEVISTSVISTSVISTSVISTSVTSESGQPPDGKLYLCIAHDITGRLAAEQALRESEALYGSVIAALDEGVILQDEQGVILAANAGAERILEIEASQLIGRARVISRWRAIHEDGEAFPVQTHPPMVALQTGEAQSNVVMGLHMPNGSLKWVSVNSSVVASDEWPELRGAQEPAMPGGRASAPIGMGPLTNISPSPVRASAIQAIRPPRLVISSISDITERRMAEEELLRARERYVTLCDNVSDFISVHDPKGMFLEASIASMELLGYTPEELRGINILGQIHPEDSALVTDAYRMLVGMGANCNFKYRIKRKSAEYIWLETFARAVTGTHIGDVEILCISHKVRERRNMQAEALTRDQGPGARSQGLAMGLTPGSRSLTPLRDELTSLLNRRAIDELLNFKLASPRASNYPFGCLILDIDHLDTINNTHGRSAGDALLQKMGQLLVESCRGEDYVARYRDDEFVIVLPNTDAAGTVLVAERIVNTVRVANFFRGPGIGERAASRSLPLSAAKGPEMLDRITVSMGGTCIRRPSDLGQGELMEIINSQLSEAKAMGRDRFVMNARETARQIEKF